MTRNYETIFFCEKCGRPVDVKNPPITKTCQYCRAKETRLRNPNVPIELTKELTITTAVRNRLRKRADKEIPRSKSEVIGKVILNLFWLATFPLAFLIGHLISPDNETTYGLIGGWAITLITGLAIMKILETPKRTKDAGARHRDGPR